MAKANVFVAVGGLLVFGCLNTLTTKIQFTLTSIGSGGHEKLFQKPWFGTFAMFLGMTFVLFIHNAIERSKKSKKTRVADTESQKPSATPLLETPSDGITGLRAFCYVGIPGTFDLVASGLCFCGLLYISASIWQMLRGSMIIFSTVISIVALGRSVLAFQWVGVMLCVIGICLVGVSNTLNARATGAAHADSGTSSGGQDEALFGMALVLFGQVVQASQVVAEEKLLKDVKLPALQIVGYEGIWGLIEMLLVVFPLCYLLSGTDNGHFEDTADTVVMLENSADLRNLVAVYIFSCATYNVAGMMVTDSLSAVHRTMLEASRTALIWAVDLSVHYFIDPASSFGEAWMPYSWVQLFGFAFLICGQLVYSAILKIPKLYYPREKATSFSSPASQRYGSPLPAYVEDAGDTISITEC